MNAGSQVIEDFWGVELSKSKKEARWEEEENDDSDSLYTDKSLELRQACLGATAKEGERNVVQLTTENDEGDKVTHSILSMRVGATEQTALFLTLKPPVSFELVQGNGPVHIVGQINESFDMSMLSSDEDSDESGDEKIPNKEVKGLTSDSKKRPPTSPAPIPSKMAKYESMDVNNSSRLDEEEESEEEDDENESEDEDESEDEGDSEEEITTKSPPKKFQSNGKTKTGKGKNLIFKTPQPQKQAGKQQKGSHSLPTTPKTASEKKKAVGGGGKGATDLNEIKQRLLKMTVPKKLEKFNNFIGNSFKIKDESIKKQLWEYVQKNRPKQ